METQSENPFSAELRLVLLGRKGTGKSSAGNTILSLTGGFETGKPTEECVKRRADIAGHRVTVVDTPGWEWYYSGNGTPGWVRRETMRSVSLCPPGPHALLLVVRSSASVTEDYYLQIEEHLELLGKTVWAHTMVLFTRGDELGSVPIEQRIQNGGKFFQKLLQRCGNRFHVLENKRRSTDGAQVVELMRKMEVMVKENEGRHYSSDPLLLVLEKEGKRRARERRKKQRLMEAQTQRGVMKAVLTVDASQTEDMDENTLFSRGSRRLPELRLILLGERETGKSSAGNAILRGVTYFQTGQATEECLRQQAEVSGRLVTVVDAPGWEGGPDGITPERVKREIGVSVTLCPPGPHALLLTLRVDALVRASAVREHLELLGEGVWRHTILLFTRGDQLREGVTIDQHVQGGGRDLHWLMEKCGNRYHVISSICLESQSCNAHVTGLLEKIEKMVSGNRCEAFSPLVQEIQELGKQKNERFNHKLKEVNEKLQRQETELRRMREREVKSIRWFFDRKKDKTKSPEKMSTERKEATDRGEDDRRSIMSELEERMTWLTEETEKEIQELSLENSRVIAALNQGYREKDELVMNLDEKERESEELKEKVDELQVKVLELERLTVLKEQERKEREGEHEKEVNMLKDKLHQKEKEGEELKRRVEWTENKIVEYEDEILHAKQEIERIQATKNMFERKLEEQHKVMEEITLKAENKVREQEEKWKEINEKREREMNKLRKMIELMTNEMEELQIAFQEQVKTSEAERQMHENTVIKYNELVDKLLGKDAEIVAIQQRQKEQEIAKVALNQEKLQEKDLEINNLGKRYMEKEQDMAALEKNLDILRNESQAKVAEFTSRIKHLEGEYKEMEEKLLGKDAEIVAIQQRQKEQEITKNAMNQERFQEKDSEINDLRKQNMEKEQEMEALEKIINILKNESHAKIAEFTSRIKLSENEYKEMEEFLKRENEILKEEMEVMRNLYEENMRKKDDGIEVKENIINQLRQENKDSETFIEDLRKQLREGQICNGNLQNQNTALMEELDGLHLKCEGLKKELQAQKEEKQSREKEIKDVLNQYEEIGKIKEALSQEQIEEKEKEIFLLKQFNHTQQLDLDALKERSEELEERIEEMKKYYEERLQERMAEMDVKDAERERALHSKELELSEREQILRQNVQELDRGRKDLKIKEDEISLREQELGDGKQELAKRELKVRDKEKELEHQRQNNQSYREDLVRREDELKRREEELADAEQEIKQKREEHEATVKTLESRQKAQKELSDKQEKDIGNLRQALEEREKVITRMEEELVAKQLSLREEKKILENHRENMEIREQGLKKRQQQLVDSECVYEKKTQELSTSVQELEKKQQDHEKWQQELTEKEYDLTQRLNDCKEKEQELSKREYDLELKTEELMENSQAFETIKANLAKREEELINTMEKLETFKQDLTNKEKDLDMKEQQINKKYDEFVAAEKIMESKQKAQNDLQDIEYIRQQLEVKEKDLKKMEEELLLKQNELKEDLEKQTENLKTKESDLHQREKHLMDSQQMCEIKTQELSKGLQDLEKNKEENEKWQTELTIKECDLIQRLNELEKKEQDLFQEEHDIVLMNEATQEIEMHQQQLLASQQNQTTNRLEKELEELRQASLKREQELMNKEDELQKREQHLRSAEIYLKKREEIVQNREGEVQINQQRHDAILSDLQKKQETKSSLEKKQHELDQLEKQFINREQNVAVKEQELSIRYKELDIKENYRENQELNLKSREQELNELKEVLESKKTDIANCTSELENQKHELRNERELVQMKSEELEKWEKYLYNMELQMVNNNPNSQFLPWGQIMASNGKQGVMNGQKMYQEVGVDGKLKEKARNNIRDEEDDQSLENAISETANCASELSFQSRRKRKLEAKTEEGGDEMEQWEEESGKEEDGEEFLDPVSSVDPMTLGLHSSLQELRVVLLAETSRRSARHTILGQDAEIGNPWRGTVSGQALMLVEPCGIKWRSANDINMTTDSVKKEIMHNVSLCAPGPHAFVLILPAYLTFTGQYRKAVEQTMTTLGEASWKYAIILFTWGEALGESGQQHIKRNGDLEWLVKKCGGRYHVLDNRHRAAHMAQLLEKISKMVAGNFKHYYQAK